MRINFAGQRSHIIFADEIFVDMPLSGIPGDLCTVMVLCRVISSAKPICFTEPFMQGAVYLFFFTA